nr:P-loop NTPase fold protein [Abyssogena phaseoliformis symbiont]
MEYLERIKHIFGIERLVFVLSIDKKNLAKSIQSQYGNIDANNYLRRFIDLEFDFKNPGINKFCDVLCQNFKLNDILVSKEISVNEVHERGSYLFAMRTLATGFNLSLRQVEQIFIKLQIIFKTTEHRIVPKHLLVLALFGSLKSYDNNLYLGLINRRAEAKKAIKALIIAIKDDEFRGNELEDFKIEISAIIDTTTLSDNELDALIKQKEDELLTIDNKDSQEYLKLRYYIAILKYSPGDWDDYRYNQMTKAVIKKVDFADKFNFD